MKTFRTLTPLPAFSCSVCQLLCPHRPCPKNHLELPPGFTLAPTLSSSILILSQFAHQARDTSWEGRKAGNVVSSILLSIRNAASHMGCSLYWGEQPWKEAKRAGCRVGAITLVRGAYKLSLGPRCNCISCKPLNLISCGFQIIFYFQLCCCSHYRFGDYKCWMTREKGRGGEEFHFAWRIRY